MTVSVTRKFWETKERKGSRRLATPGPQTKRPVGRLPRVTKLMALAIRFDQLIRDGVLKDQAEIARLGMVTRARVTQIMNLLNLAPAIQVAILKLPPMQNGRDEVTERRLRVVFESERWSRQIEVWQSTAARVAIQPVPLPRA